MTSALTILTTLPIAGALTTITLGSRNKTTPRWIALAFSLATLALTLILWHTFDPTSTAMQFQQRHLWIAPLNIEYRTGIDGLSLLMLLLSAIVTPIAIVASWHISDRTNLYFALILLLQSCLFGTFTTLNFIPFFLFWELSLIPAFFLIHLWGGPNRPRAATQFLVYTMVGSIAMLLTFLALFLATHTFDLTDLATLAQHNQLLPAVFAKLASPHITTNHIALLLFAGAFLGFAVKVPLFPFHTWLPSAYAEAPTGATILLTGAMSKMGLYGLLRILLPIFAPQMQSVLTPLLWLSLASILFSAYAALAQTDLKRIFAYSSINHLGYCLLAIFAIAKSTNPTLLPEKYAAMNGLFLQTFNHALTAATLFLFIALLERRSNGLRSLDDFGGLRKAIPIFTGLMGIALFSSLGLPGLNGFPGEFLLFKGTFPLTPAFTSLATLGLLITAIFILGILQRVFSGPLNPTWSTMPDLTTYERLALAPLIILIFALGLYPQLILRTINTTAMHLIQTISN
ncbi:MAG TPA: NADH-quinone oxidoreductase subunit M [Acidobacteriaceae bacterium]|nr:NADH-quinone oxidoreductase subunit M [Acidobacteriaceae bacterium]